MSARFTLAAPATLSQEIRKSRFVAHARTVDATDAALDFVARVSDANATHNCWAYRIDQYYRFNDDGEPAGTAGKPILQAIDGQQLDRVVVVVTRWFGGIKLGAGGLVRAYGGCAAECLRLAAKTEIITLAAVEFMLPFALLPLLHARLAELQATKLGERYESDGVVLRVSLPADRVATLRTLLADATRGGSTLSVVN
ncbi:MAG: YigZ family protein [Gammaproteobacteria bacterium]|nr:MAG: YigZ family protein [Gammaproteobacteria bacterium]